MANDPSSKGGSTAAADRKKAALPESVRQGLEVTEMDNELAALRARFEQFFMGLEKRSPAPDCEEYKKRLLRLKGGFIRNTAVKFRVNALHQKFMAYERLWLKTLKEIEEGTYRRDLFKLRRKKSLADSQGPGPKAKAAAPVADSIDDLDVNLDDFNEEAAPPAPVAAPASPPPAPKPVAAPPPAAPPPAAKPVVAQPPASPPPAARPVAAQPPAAPPPASKPSVAPPSAAVRPPTAAGPAARPAAGPAESKPAAATLSNATAPGAPKPVAPKPSASLSLSSAAAAKPTPSITLTSGLGAKSVAPRTVSQPAVPAAAPAKPAAPAPRTVSQPGAPAASSAPKPGAPARPASPPAAPRPAAGSSDPLSKERVQAIYDAYVTAKRQCKENTSGLTYDAVAQSLQKQVPKLMQQPGVKSVDFKVVIKDGKAVLKAVTKQ